MGSHTLRRGEGGPCGLPPGPWTRVPGPGSAVTMEAIWETPTPWNKSVEEPFTRARSPQRALRGGRWGPRVLHRNC